MGFPSSYNQITIRQYIHCHEIIKKGLSAADENIEIAAYLSGQTVDEFSSLPFKSTDPLIRKVQRIKASKPNPRVPRFMRIGWKFYRPVISMDQFSSARLLYLETHHKLNEKIAVLFQPFFKYHLTDQGCLPNSPAHEWDALAEKILDKKVNDVYGVVFFYARSWKRLNPAIQDCIEKAVQKINHLTKEILEQDQSGQTSPVTTDGTGTLTY